AYTIHAFADGYTDVWRQVIVSAGRGVVPIDIRLTLRGTSATTPAASLSVPPGVTAPVTSVGGQSLAGLLPLGWSPPGAAAVRANGPGSATLPFTIPGADVAASGKALTTVAYDSSRDVWRVIPPAAPITGDSAQVSFTLAPLGEVALVYPDAGTGIAAPP